MITFTISSQSVFLLILIFISIIALLLFRVFLLVESHNQLQQHVITQDATIREMAKVIEIMEKNLNEIKAIKALTEEASSTASQQLSYLTNEQLLMIAGALLLIVSIYFGGWGISTYIKSSGLYSILKISDDFIHSVTSSFLNLPSLPQSGTEIIWTDAGTNIVIKVLVSADGKTGTVLFNIDNTFISLAQFLDSAKMHIIQRSLDPSVQDNLAITSACIDQINNL